MAHRHRRHLFRILEGQDADDRLARLVDGALLTLIGLNVIVIALETVPDFAPHSDPRLRRFYLWFEVFSVAVFTVEYVCRLWVSVESPGLKGLPAWQARLKTALTPMLIIDLMAILPSYLLFMGLVPYDLRVLRIVRLVRILQLARYSPAMQTFATVIHKERRTMLSALLIMLMMLVIASSLIYFAEHRAQPEDFSSIPASMWWAMSTLTGIGLLVLWTGIFASSFVEELRSREFKVTWNMVTQVPAFANMPAADVAEIAGMMRPLIVPARYTIVRFGETGDAMFFVCSGEVEVEIPPEPVVLGPGTFFGEVALLHDTVRQASVIALTECRLMMLEADDFRTLIQKHESVRHAIETIAAERETLWAT